MANIYTYLCDTCDHLAQVAGGFASGMDFQTRTIACLTCGRLEDALATKILSRPDYVAWCAAQTPPQTPAAVDDFGARFVEWPLACGRDARHAVGLWPPGSASVPENGDDQTVTGPCPRRGCAGTMAPDPKGPVVLAD